jgi:hypothetical protein
MKQVIIGAAIMAFTAAESMYNAQKSEAAIYNTQNFQKQVTNNREKGISIVQFYNGDEQASKSHQGQYEKFAIENKGMFRIGTINCKDFKSICDKEEMTEFPSYKVYPPIPVPAFEVKQGAELDTDTLKKSAYRFIGNRSIDLNSNNIKTFIEDQPMRPKMLLFTETKSAPMVYRALSTYVDKTLEFGMVKKEEADLVKQYKVTKFPTFVLLKPG